MRRKPPEAGGITVALLYIRVSGREQQREGLSLPAQLADCQRYARDRGMIIGGTYQDVMRGTREDRPQYQAMLADIRRLRTEGQHIVIVVKWLHRLGRKVLESVRCREELGKLGVPIHAIANGGVVDDFLANIMAATAQYEVEQLGDRVSAVWEDVERNGWRKVGGPVAWGYVLRDATPAERAMGAPKKVLEIDRLAAPYVREAFERVAEGESSRSVGAWVAGLSDEIRGGRRLGWSRVRQILESPVYVARPESGVANILARPVGHWPALVDDETFRRVQERMADHRRVPRQASGEYLLTGLLRCGVCGGRMHGARTRVRGLKDPRRYRCQGKRGGMAAPTCHRTAGAASLDTSVMGQVFTTLAVAYTTDPVLYRALEQAWEVRRQGDGRTNVVERAAALRTRIETLRLRLTRATERYCDNLIGKDEYDALCARAQADIKAAQAEYDELPTAEPKPKLRSLDEILHPIKLALSLVEADVALQRKILAGVIDRVTFIRERAGRHWRYQAIVTWDADVKAYLETIRALQAAA